MDAVTISEHKILYIPDHLSGRSNWGRFRYIIFEYICYTSLQVRWPFLSRPHFWHQPALSLLHQIHLKSHPSSINTNRWVNIPIHYPFNRARARMRFSLRRIPFLLLSLSIYFGQSARCCSELSLASSQRSRKATRCENNSFHLSVFERPQFLFLWVFGEIVWFYVLRYWLVLVLSAGRTRMGISSSSLRGQRFNGLIPLWRSKWLSSVYFSLICDSFPAYGLATPIRKGPKKIFSPVCHPFRQTLGIPGSVVNVLPSIYSKRFSNIRSDNGHVKCNFYPSRITVGGWCMFL